MRNYLILPIALLAGCDATGMSTYAFKEGATVSSKSNEMFSCRLAATKQVPVNTQIASTPVYQTPTYTTPYYTTCNGYSCITTGGQTTGGQIYGGQTYSYDANAEIRDEFVARCMAGKGYQFAQLPVCASGSVPKSLTQELNGKLRAPREGACLAAVSGEAANVVYLEELAK